MFVNANATKYSERRRCSTPMELRILFYTITINVRRLRRHVDNPKKRASLPAAGRRHVVGHILIPLTSYSCNNAGVALRSNYGISNLRKVTEVTSLLPCEGCRGVKFSMTSLCFQSPRLLLRHRPSIRSNRRSYSGTSFRYTPT